jgi:hypothetical protein
VNPFPMPEIRIQKQGCALLSLVLDNCALIKRAVSSVVEHYLDTVGVTGSNPVSRTRAPRRRTPRNTAKYAEKRRLWAL